MHHHFLRLTLVLSLLVSLAVPVIGADTEKLEADAKVWSGLYYAGPEDKTKGIVPEGRAAKLVERMKLVEQLQFPTYRLIGAVSEDVLREYESWVLPSEVFFIKLDSLGRDDEGALNATLNIWQQKSVLLKASMKLRKGRPMFVRGPKWGDGYIVIALLLE